MKKTLNFVIYLPNYAGNFIRFILSLDERTYPIHHYDQRYDDIKTSRKLLYSYKNLLHRYGAWDAFEQKFISPARDPLPLFLNQDTYLIHTLTAHPGPRRNGLGFSEGFLKKYEDVLLDLNVNYLQVRLSEKYSSMPDFFNEKIGHNMRAGFPLSHITDDQNKEYKNYDRDFTKKYNPYQINLDSFLEGKDSFITEYEKVSDHLGLYPHIDDALELYEDWYRARKIQQYLETLR